MDPFALDSSHIAPPRSMVTTAGSTMAPAPVAPPSQPLISLGTFVLVACVGIRFACVPCKGVGGNAATAAAAKSSAPHRCVMTATDDSRLTCAMDHEGMVGDSRVTLGTRSFFSNVRF